MGTRIQQGGLQVAQCLHRLINDEILPGTGVDADRLWRHFDAIVHELGPINRQLLKRRDEIQARLDTGRTRRARWTRRPAHRIAHRPQPSRRQPDRV